MTARFPSARGRAKHGLSARPCAGARCPVVDAYRMQRAGGSLAVGTVLGRSPRERRVRYTSPEGWRRRTARRVISCAPASRHDGRVRCLVARCPKAPSYRTAVTRNPPNRPAISSLEAPRPGTRQDNDGSRQTHLSSESAPPHRRRVQRRTGLGRGYHINFRTES